jgi:N-acetylglucosamine malate deacetylase 2
LHKHVVVILPHPDDESFGCSGTVAKFRKQGIPVTYLCGTLGEMGRNMGNPKFANRETLPDVRKQELINACKVLDMELVMLGLRDKTIEFESRDEIAAMLKEHLEKISPTLVITHYPDHAVHPDHNAMGAAVIEAVKQMEEERRPEVWAQAITLDKYETLGQPDVVMDVKDVFDIKLKAIECHKSQFGGILNKIKESIEEQGENREVYEQFYKEEFYKWKF